MRKISIIIPVFNTEKYLHKCVNSVINQECSNYEIILIDDGSQDLSSKICDEFEKKYSFIKVFHQENNGAASARNKGIRMAKGEFITFIDSDDYWDSRKVITKMNKILDKNINLDVILFDFIKRNEINSKKLSSVKKMKKHMIENKSREEVISYLVKEGLFKTSACLKLIKKSILVKNNIFFEEGIVAEDIDWGLNVFQHSEKFDVITEPFYIYRWREGSVSKSINIKLIQDLWYVVKKWIVKMEEVNNEEVSKSIRTYLAHHYSILLGLTGYIKNKSLKIKIRDELKGYKYILDCNYTDNFKSKIVRNLYKIIGFNNLMIILNLFLRIKSRFRF